MKSELQTAQKEIRQLQQRAARLRMLAHVHTLTYMLRRWNFGSSKLRVCASSFREAQALCAFGF